MTEPRAESALAEPDGAGVARWAIREAGRGGADIYLSLPLGTIRVVSRGGAVDYSRNGPQAVRRELLEYAVWLLRRDQLGFSDLFGLGVKFVEPGTEPGALVVRHVALEEAALEARELLRSPLGTALRRVEANGIASVLDALLQRARQRVRR